MATDVSAQTRAQSSTFPMMVLIAGWLIPGAGHFMLRKWIRGTLLAISIVAMFCIGLALKGKIYSPNTGDLLDILNFAGDLGNGLLYVLARVFDLGQVNVQVATCSTSSPPSTPTRWQRGGSARDHLTLRSSSSLLSLHLGRLRHHPAHRTPHDDSLRRLLLRPLRRRHHRCKLGHVAHQTLNVLVSPNPSHGIAIESPLP
jgi:hypothetical protein